MDLRRSHPLPRPSTVEELRGLTGERLRSRRAEIEAAVLTRTYAISDPTDAEPAYREGLRASVAIALDYALEAIELGEGRAPPLPPALLAQARMAARAGIGLDTVLRRYLAGYTLLGEFLVEELEQGGPRGATSAKRLMRGQAAVFDRLLAAVSEEYSREAKSGIGSSEERRAERVERLLAGEPIDSSALDYDFEAHHTGLLAVGPGAAAAIRELAGALDSRRLLVERDELTAWAWLARSREADPAELDRLLRASWPERLHLAIGEPAGDLAGWRLTHRQAAAALPVALRGPDRIVRYAEVSLLAAALRDDLLASSLRELYLAPLGAERDGGRLAKETLRAYFAAERNVSSTASSLGVGRRTVTNRLRNIEELIGRPLGGTAPALQLALDLDRLAQEPSVLPGAR